MFFLLPLAHEESSVRRWPLFAIAVVILNVIVLALGLTTQGGADEAVTRATAAAQAFAEAHPSAAAKAPAGCVTAGASTSVSSVVEDLVPKPPRSDDGPESDDAPSRAPRPATKVDPRAEAEAAQADEAKLSALCADVDAARAATFDHRFGFVPAKPAPWTLLTHQFVYTGVLHLLLDLWFFWLTGCNLEDRWGKPIFASFYLLAGVAGALLHARFTSAPEAPLIGASAAIAGAMGGFLAVLGATRIRFGYLIWITLKPRVGTFEASALWMFPLWILAELCQALFLTDAVRAHWAPVGGFAFGLAVGLVMKYSGLDAKLDARAEDASTVRQDARILGAAALSDQGKYDEASRELEAYLREAPDDVDALVELLRAVTASRDVPRRVAVSVRLMNAYLQRGFSDAAVDLYTELRQSGLEGELSKGDALHLGEALARRQKGDAALSALRRARQGGLVDADAVRAGVTEATILARSGKTAEATKLLDECKASPFLTFELEQRVDAQLAAMRGIAATPQ